MKTMRFFFISIAAISLLFGSCKKECGIGFNQSISYGTFTDSRDGNVYKTVTIGNQVWMAGNLRYVKGQQADETVVCSIYGQLYSRYDTAGAAPEGWHIPSKEEWQTLIDYLGGQDVAGGKLKEAGTEHWAAPNTGADNESGFSALAAGVYDGNSGIAFRNQKAYFWTSSGTGNDSEAVIVNLFYDNKKAIVSTVSSEYLLYSIRCIKDR